MKKSEISIGNIEELTHNNNNSQLGSWLKDINVFTLLMLIIIYISRDQINQRLCAKKCIVEEDEAEVVDLTQLKVPLNRKKSQRSNNDWKF